VSGRRLRGSVPAGAPAQFIRFLVVGGVNTAISYGIYAGLVFMGWHYAAANLVAVAAGVVVSFTTTGRLVFGHRDNRRFGRYVVAWGGIYVTSVSIIGVMLRLTGDPYAAGALAIPPIAVMSYVAQRFFVFRSDERERRSAQSTDRVAPAVRQERAS